MEWPTISEVFAIKPISDERKRREWIKSKKKIKKIPSGETSETKKEKQKNDGEDHIDIYV